MEYPSGWAVFDGPATAAESLAALLFAEAARRAGLGESFHVALSGGSTPKAAYEALARLSMPWERCRFYLVDERVVPLEDEARNETMIRRALGPQARIRSLGAKLDAESMALAGEEQLPVRLHWAVMGIGEDGHTASLFPGEPEAHGRMAPARGPAPHPQRVTLTYSELARVERLLFLVTGASKASILERIWCGEADDLPVARVANSAPSRLFVTDYEAARLYIEGIGRLSGPTG